VPRDGFIRNRARKAPVAAFAIETEQVVAIGVGFADPQFADYAAIGQRLIHIGSPQKMVALAWQRFRRLGGSRIATIKRIWCIAARIRRSVCTETLIRKKRIPTKGLSQMLCAK
jgi:hypothetical protein